MLIAMDPSETVDVVLSGYEKLDKPPTFVCRMPTARERTKMNRLVQQALEHETAGEPEKTDEDLAGFFALALVTWKNVQDRDGKEVPFDPTKLGDLLTWHELWELRGLCWNHTHLSELAKKKSAVPPTSGAEPSAEIAKADAKTGTP